MDRRAFSLSLASLSLGSSAATTAGTKRQNELNELRGARTFTQVGKELRPFAERKEAVLAEKDGRGFMDHMWVGGDFANFTRLRVRIYVDGEVNASIDMEIGLGAGVGFADPAAPWGTQFSGITGAPSGIFINYRIPFGRHLRVTAELPEGTANDVPFWWIIRGLENMPLTVGGLSLPETARLRLHTVKDRLVEPLGFFDLCQLGGGGMVFLVAIAAQSTSFDYLEAQMRAYVDGSGEAQMLSSGLEDYFLGTYYFNRGLYHLPQGGLTHKDEKQHSFSAYRFHVEDPIVFSSGLRLVCRCGEQRGDKVYGPSGMPSATTYTTYAWVYEW